MFDLYYTYENKVGLIFFIMYVILTLVDVLTNSMSFSLVKTIIKRSNNMKKCSYILIVLILLFALVMSLSACKIFSDTNNSLPGESEHEHVFGPWFDDTATCTSSGSHHRRCTIEGCDAYDTEITDPTGHNIINGVCERCGKNLCDHEYEGFVTKEPACTEWGYQKKICTICGSSTYEEKISKLGHDYDNNNICTRCGDNNNVSRKITLYPRNGSDKVELYVKEGSPIPEPEAPIREGYVFLGWYVMYGYNNLSYQLWNFDNDLVGDGNILLGAKWDAPFFDVTFETNGGELSSNGYYSDERNCYFFPTPERHGYEFEGWYKDSAFSGYDVNAASPSNPVITVYAKWKLIVNRITYELGTGTNAASNPKTYDVESGNVILEKPTRLWHNFDGWYLDPEFTEPISVIDVTQYCRNLTLYAKWVRTDYNYTVSDGKATITQFQGKNTVVEIPSVIDGYPVTQIGDSVFKNNTTMTSVVISDGIESIGSSAFEGCTSLTEIKIPDSVTTIGDSAFSCCSAVTSISLGDGLKTIGNSAFKNCYLVTDIVIPDSVITINESAFAKCYSLLYATIGKGLENIGVFTFSDCHKLVEIYNLSKLNLKNISTFKMLNIYSETDGSKKTFETDDGFIFYEDGDKCYMLGYTGDVSNPSLPESCHGKNYEIYHYAFEYYPSFTEVTIPDSVTAIGDYSFYGKTELLKVVIPNTVTKIGQYAFYNCISLSEINIPNNATYIGSYAFYGCSSIKSIVIPDSVTTIWERAFEGCSSLTFADLGDGITEIPWALFKNCASLTGVVIGNSIMSIGDSAFYNCSSLKAAIIPEKVRTIGLHAFAECTSLEIITIKNSNLSSIDYDAFRSCESLKTVYITDLNAWYKITFSDAKSNPLCNGALLYLEEYEILHTEIKDIVIPENITKINAYTFYGCLSITSVTIHENVTYIGIGAFGECTALSSAVFEDPTNWWRYLSTATNNNTEFMPKYLSQPDVAAKSLNSSFSKYRWEKK